MTADRAAATATSVALPSGPTERSLRPHVAAGLAGVVVHFVLMLRLPDLRAAAELGVVLTRPFWVQMLPSVVLAGVYVGSVAAWRAWRGRWRA